MRFHHAVGFDTELLMGGEVIEQGRTLLPEPGPKRFESLRNWAQLCANAEDQPVEWRAKEAGEVVASGTAHPQQRGTAS